WTLPFKPGDWVGNQRVVAVSDERGDPLRRPPTPSQRQRGFAGERAVLLRCECGVERLVALGKIYRFKQCKSNQCTTCRNRAAASARTSDQQRAANAARTPEGRARCARAGASALTSEQQRAKGQAAW